MPTPDLALADLALADRFDALVALLRGRRVVALTGAGCSTESGIPDYRGPQTRLKARNPVKYLDFVRKPEARQRYWARSAVGWPVFRDTRPNAGHRALAALEQAGVLCGLITQNVDRLHHKAGSRRVVELHGALAEVRCLQCGAFECRDALQQRILAANPDWPLSGIELAPDGDAELGGDILARFTVPDCRACGGVLKPYVVFFGENVPRPIVDQAWGMLDEADALLVVGSSLTVFSGYRFVREAARRGMPVAIVNQGETRGDKDAALLYPGRCGDTLPALARALGAR